MDLDINHDELKIRLNKNLVQKQNLSQVEVDYIKNLHIKSYEICKEIKKTDDTSKLKQLASEWEENQFLLQIAWGFNPDRNYHKFWELPKCDCPSMDNDDKYPYGNYYKSGGCLLHGC
jgi:hypothetical protein